MMKVFLASIVTCFILMSTNGSVRADELTAFDNLSPTELLHQFSKAWDESHWTEKSGRIPDGYMLSADDRGWKVRMRVLQKLIASGESAIPALLDALKSESAPERILAAQALGYLAPHVPTEPLFKAAKSDADAAVRLYAVDSLGMQGTGHSGMNWDQLLKDETNRDVQKHIRYAKEREQQSLDPAVTKRLIEWDAKQIDAARVGQPAPDFTLVSATGETVRLSQFQGKKAVVLVFIYGDT